MPRATEHTRAYQHYLTPRAIPVDREPALDAALRRLTRLYEVQEPEQLNLFTPEVSDGLREKAA